MEVFRAPRVSLIARPEFLEPEHLRVQWQGSASAGERLAEFAGRICYMSQHNPANRSAAEYLENIKKQGHGSALEHAVYGLLIEGVFRSFSREAARSVLTNATEVKIVVSGNARAWRTMLELRTSEGAELEIRRMAIACLRVLRDEAAALFADFEIYLADDKHDAARVAYHKV